MYCLSWGSHGHHCLCCSAVRHGPTCLTKASFLACGEEAEWCRQLPASACAPSVWAGQAVVWLLTRPYPPPSCTTLGLRLWLGLVLWGGGSGGVPGLLLGAWDHPVASVAQKNVILSLGPGVVPPEMPVAPLAADARSTGAALLQSMAQSGVDLLPGQMGASCGAKASCSGSAAPAVAGSQGAWLPLGLPWLAPAFPCLSKVLRCWERLWGKGTASSSAQTHPPYPKDH